MLVKMSTTIFGTKITQVSSTSVIQMTAIQAAITRTTAQTNIMNIIIPSVFMILPQMMNPDTLINEEIVTLQVDTRDCQRIITAKTTGKQVWDPVVQGAIVSDLQKCKESETFIHI